MNICSFITFLFHFYLVLVLTFLNIVVEIFPREKKVVKVLIDFLVFFLIFHKIELQVEYIISSINNKYFRFQILFSSFKSSSLSLKGRTSSKHQFYGLHRPSWSRSSKQKWSILSNCGTEWCD